jgi:manganese/iron transport system permease protein
MMVMSAALGATAGVLGLYVSWYTDLAAGGVIVLTATALFLASLVLSPKSGLLAGLLRGRDARAGEAARVNA